MLVIIACVPFERDDGHYCSKLARNGFNEREKSKKSIL